MEILKKIDDIDFHTIQCADGKDLDVSEPVVMSSAAGWYVGSFCVGEYCTEPYDRYSDYYATPEEASKQLPENLS